MKHFKEGQIWFADFSGAIGTEQKGSGPNNLRPVLIFKKYNQKMFWGIACTTQIKDSKYHINIGEINKRLNFCILSQNRTFDASRLKYKISNIEFDTRKIITKNLQEILKDSL